MNTLLRALSLLIALGWSMPSSATVIFDDGSHILQLNTFDVRATNALNFDLFDPTKGTLDRVEIGLTSTIISSNIVKSGNSIPQLGFTVDSMFGGFTHSNAANLIFSPIAVPFLAFGMPLTTVITSAGTLNYHLIFNDFSELLGGQDFPAASFSGGAYSPINPIASSRLSAFQIQTPGIDSFLETILLIPFLSGTITRMSIAGGGTMQIDYFYTAPTSTTTAVPEPGVALLLGVGFLALFGQRRRRKA